MRCRYLSLLLNSVRIAIVPIGLTLTGRPLFLYLLLVIRFVNRTIQLLCFSSSLLLSGFSIAQDSLIDAPLPHSKGQSVSPSFEGWYANPDGTHSLVFGYFNRNYDEQLSLPIGQGNRFEPGPTDRGQPTYFLPRRQTGVFAVRVPADFGDQQLIWSLTANGETIAIPGQLRPEWEITALEEVTSGNRPPVIRFAGPASESGTGPLGIKSAALSTTAGEETQLTIWASDDGVKKSRQKGRPARFGVVLSKYRGIGEVSIDAIDPAIENGKAETSAVFSRPGEYVLRVLAWDDSGGQSNVMAGGFFCCWTNGFITVLVE